MRKSIFSVLFLATACGGGNFDVGAPSDASPDTRLSEGDTGKPEDTGSEPESAPLDTGDVVAEAGDALPSEGGPSEAGAEIGPPECSGDILGCFATNQPKVCIEGKWQNSGGACTWACDAGKCACGVTDRFLTNPLSIGPGEAFYDQKRLKGWIAQAQPYGNMDIVWAKTQCGTSYRLPTKGEVLDIIAQQAPATLCKSTQNLDPKVYTTIKADVGGSSWPTEASLFDTPVWTSDTSGSLAVTVQLNTGIVGTRDPAVKVRGLLLCIKK